MSSLQGMTLGKYRIVEQIGRGGMATVYKAYQPGLDRYVAVKVLPPYYAHEEGFVERFKQEARAVARLRHPNILTVYDFGESDGLTYIVMEFVESGTLKERLGRPLPLDKAVALTIQVAGALDHAHSEGIIHRDVKPSNVLLPREDWALLTDFGIAKVVESTLALTKTGVGIGTPEYMSPEQGQGTQLDGRSDIYSLGVMLYEMATGRVPFTADTPFAIVMKHMTEPLPMPHQLNPGVPESIERVILKAMAKEPAERYQTAGEMVQALDAIRLAGEVAVPRKTPPMGTEVVAPGRRRVTPPPPTAGRRRFNLMWLAIPLVALLLLAGGYLALSNRGPSEARPTEVRGIARVVSTSTRAPAPTVARTSTSAPTLLATKAPTKVVAVAATTTLRPTQAVAGAATATLKPTDVPTAAPATATLRPAAPTATARPAGPTATLRPQATATQAGYAAPVLIEPAHEARFNGGQVWLRWEWKRQLGTDDYFDVRLWQGGQAHQGIAWTKEAQYLLNLDTRGEAWYHWSVAVIRGRDGKWEQDLSPEAEARSFYRSGGGAPPGQPTPTYALPTRPP